MNSNAFAARCWPCRDTTIITARWCRSKRSRSALHMLNWPGSTTAGTRHIAMRRKHSTTRSWISSRSRTALHKLESASQSANRSARGPEGTMATSHPAVDFAPNFTFAPSRVRAVGRGCATVRASRVPHPNGQSGWLYVFGTAVKAGRRFPEKYGVVGDYVPDGFARQQAFPFRRIG
ncbi:hypothetical protein BCAR13_370048 [Paraburkholderia caribensis]|nr:hypothetical protein BCAR13_370048 [Paraburkholderia caribensis]